MTLHVLQDRSQIAKARQELVNMGASQLDRTASPLRSLMNALGLGHGMVVGDMLKSWDVLATVNFLANRLKKDHPILDIGCYASEVLVVLHKLGYSHLAGVDLNPHLSRMPYQDFIRYEVADFRHTPFEDASFQAITSISVIEHGFDGPALLKEMSRLLRVGGYFICSFDYWPDKIDTTGTRFFGMDWKIFSREEVIHFVADAANHGLHPVGELMFDRKDSPIASAGKQYTFGWLVLARSA